MRVTAMGQCFTSFSKFKDREERDLSANALPPVLMLNERCSDTVQLFPDGPVARDRAARLPHAAQRAPAPPSRRRRLDIVP